MTTPETFARTPQVQIPFVFPDPPEDRDDKMTNYDQQAATGRTHYLIEHLGNPETTLVIGERYLALVPTRDMTGLTYPDLLVAFDVKPEDYYRRSAYVISEQGKPPDFVLEVASRSSGRRDVVEKREIYAGLLIPEYWRFDETGRYHGVRLAGDRLANGEYESIDIAELDDGSLQGYSAVLNLNLRWSMSGYPPYAEGLARGLARGLLGWHDPATGQHIATLDSERAARRAAETRANAERDARLAAEARANAERDARLAAEARFRELEE